MHSPRSSSAQSQVNLEARPDAIQADTGVGQKTIAHWGYACHTWAADGSLAESVCPKEVSLQGDPGRPIQGSRVAGEHHVEIKPRGAWVASQGHENW